MKKLKELKSLKNTAFFACFSLGILLITLISCNKKFDQKDFDNLNTQSCPLCEHADTIAAFYEGQSFCQTCTSVYDTVQMELEHIFLNLGPEIDSNIMFFKLRTHYSTGYVWEKTVSLNNSNGSFYNLGSLNYMFLEGNTLHYCDGFSHKMGQTIKFSFHGDKI